MRTAVFSLRREAMRSCQTLHIVIMATVLLVASMNAQPAFSQRARPNDEAPRDTQPDITGYWVAVITEDWRLRMITPPVGDYQNVPLNEKGAEIARAWNPARDAEQSLACKAYGAAAIMRMPTRLHIEWESESVLRISFDHGNQTRLVYFDERTPPAVEPTWQGYARGKWIDSGGRPVRSQTASAGLQIETTHLREQYLRKNGVPVSENARVVDMVERLRGPKGDDFLVVKTIVEDPTYLTDTLVTSSHFKREANSSRWDPEECMVELPPESRLSPE